MAGILSHGTGERLARTARAGVESREMSDPNILTGYIEEALPKYQSDNAFFHRANDAVLDALPAEDEWPPVCRSLFSATGEDWLHGSHRGQRLIHFAGRFNYFGDELGPWLDKFESLLRRLYWLRAELFVLESWKNPPLCLRYEVVPGTVEVYASSAPQPPNAWRVSGHRVHVSDDEPGGWITSLVEERVRKASPQL